MEIAPPVGYWNEASNFIGYGLQSGTVTIYPVDTYKPDTFAGHGITLHDDVPGSKRHHVVVGIDQIDVGKSS